MTKEEDNAAALQATQAATDAMKEALLQLPGMLATALAQNGAAAAAAPANVPAGGAPPQQPSRDLRDRRVPDFWEHNPRAWFVILDNHFSVATTPPTEQAKFALLLPLLTATAVKQLSRFIAAPPQDVYTTVSYTHLTLPTNREV